MTEWTDDSCPRLSTGARLQWDDVREKHMLLIPEGAVELSRTAAEVLELCDGERTLSQIADDLQEKYPEASVSEDVQELIAGIAARGWIVDARS